MSDVDLFGATPDPAPRTEKERPVGEPRLVRANRHQVLLVPTSLEALLEGDHPARAIWRVVEGLDLSKFSAGIRVRGGKAGRPAIDPKILVALWLYATSEGVGGARELARLCGNHTAYRWICGGVHVNYHTLSDFRVGHQEALDELMTQVLGILKHEGLVNLKRVAQDGMRIRASAGASSFRREESLKTCLEEARQHVQQTAAAKEAGSTSARGKAAQERVVRERLARVEQALKELPKARAAKRKGKEEEARVSTTDPEARVMKMADGGFRPAYNAQFATDTESRVIVGVDVSNQGNDNTQMPPMLDDIQKRTGQLPTEHLVDGGFAGQESIEKAVEKGVKVYAPVQKAKKENVDRYEPKPSDTPPIAEWRARMGTESAKEIYKLRGATAETVNADMRCYRALDRLPVRSLPKVRCVVLWAALTYNVRQLMAAK